ncbi:MAG: GerMN domain-containing protein [Gomphosphaeria aponina SAG 52.96 = DSM 107014]|uniref:GerMN domain-containing protein n=1 Tax=Gomphosphaeria aponina SAG 52.96 = DSM 107014 TaxID=1521640 RepID=A0A941GSS6_9CHRO|nr:GerMN domain-containing protein [Gomphosphaeria aponina SAG 52.96 = DSM 107014]
MQDQQKSRRLSSGIITGISVAVLAASGIAWWVINSPHPPAPTNQTVNPTPTLPQQSEAEELQIYWLNAAGNDIELLPANIKIENAANEQELLETAFRLLLAGPDLDAYTSTIPPGTKLLGLSLKEDGVHINLSQEFTSGGGSASMTGRLGQIIYTATSLNPKEAVYIDIEDSPLEVLGGEGLIIERPMTRKDFEENFTF